MKVLLAAVNAKYIHSNLAVYSLRAYAMKHAAIPQEYQIEIAEYTINQPLDDIMMSLYGHRPDMLCLSCYLWNISYMENLMRELPKILPETQIWLGGPEVSYNARETLEKYPAATGVIVGEGEATFAQLLEFYDKYLLSGRLWKEIEAIKGIVYRVPGGELRSTAPRPPVDMNTIPFVYEHIEEFKNRIIYYESSRGCPFSCSYCLSSVDHRLRFREKDLVERELQFFMDAEVPQVKFVDRTFNCRHDHAMAIWSYIRDHDRGKTNFHFEVAADLLTAEEISLIQSMRPGLIQLEIGVQSTNEQTVEAIRRTMSLDKVTNAVSRIREGRNVHQHLDLIAGLPCEDYETFGRSFDTVYAMKPDQLQLGFLKVLRGSLMYEKAREYQLLYQDRPPYEVLSTKWLSYEDVIRLKKVEEMVEVYYNSGQFHHTMEHLEKEFSSPFAMYEALAAYYERNGLFGIQHTRLARYEILSRLFPVEKREEYMQWLTVDLYLRDNVKNRPLFLGQSRIEKAEARAFYKAEAENPRYLKGYEKYDGRQMQKMTHLERIGGNMVLFDYQNRDVLTGNARTHVIEDMSNGMQQRRPAEKI